MARLRYSALLTVALCSGCAAQLDLKQGDCSITLVQVDALASTPMVGNVEADGWVMVGRGDCSPELIELYRAVVLDE